MRTENVIKACGSVAFLCSELREAHTDALNGDNRLEELVLWNVLKKANNLKDELDAVKSAIVEDKILGTESA